MTALLAAAVGGPRARRSGASRCSIADDEALLRGAAAFETVRIRGGRPVLLGRHVERLERSALALRLPPPDGAARPRAAGGRGRGHRRRGAAGSSGPA